MGVVEEPMRYVDSPCGGHRQPVTEPATTFAPAGSTPVTRSAWCFLAPTALCARKEAADIEGVSTTGSVLAESFVMQGDLLDTWTISFGFHATSRHCIPRLAPRNSNRNATANNALQRTAPAVAELGIVSRFLASP